MIGPSILHSHSEYSTRDSLLRVDELPQLAKDRGWGAVALTDHGGVEGMVEFLDACKTVGIRGIAGVELYTSIPDSDKAHHLTVLAKNARGFMSLCKVISMAHDLGWNAKAGRASAPWKTVLNNLKDCIVLSGCASSPFWRGSVEAGTDLEQAIEAWGQDFFFEVQGLHDWDEQIALNRAVFDLSKKYSRPIVVTPDCHMADEEDYALHEGLLSIASRPFRPVGDEKAWRFSTKLSYLMSPEDLMRSLVRSGFREDDAIEAIANTELVASRVSDWDWSELPKPELPHVEGSMRELTLDALEKSDFDRLVYLPRAMEELRVFEEAGLDQYFLLVRECVQLFKSQGAFVGSRGSVGGSLVAYLLGITSVDPIRFGLPFERFYAPGRKGWPDIDLDFDPDFREKIPSLLRVRFGEQNVAQISNYMRFGPKSAIRDAVRAYQVDLFVKEEWEDPENPKEIDTYDEYHKLCEISPQAGAFARKLVGRIRQFGSHAGGFVITSEPVTETRGCLVTRGKDRVRALAWDMDAAEKLGFVKIDFLGNDSLSVLKEIELSGVKWDEVPLDDEKVYADFRDGLTAGVPQFLTSNLRTFLMMIRPENFDDLVFANAAIRPGGLSVLHSPKVLAETYRENPESLLVYQEDVMQMCVQLAGFSWSQADEIRKIIGKSLGPEQLMAWEDRFVEGCVSCKTVPEQDARTIWGSIRDFGRYSFNRSHATAYSRNAYHVAWAKRNRPAITFSALLNADEDSADRLLDEVDDFGVKILPPHVNASDLKWIVESDCVRAPLNRIPMVDTRIAKAILKRRADAGPFKDADDLKKRLGKIKYDPKLLGVAFNAKLATNFLSRVQDPRSILTHEYRESVRACDQCNFRTTCKAPVPPEVGRTNVIVVGEAPGKTEDNRGRPFIGESGKLLTAVLERFGVERKSLTFANTVMCKPPFVEGGEWVDPGCPWVLDMIAKVNPPLVLAVGRRAWHKLGGSGGIMKSNATALSGHPVVVGCVHPAAVLRDSSLLPELERAVKKFSKLFSEALEA